jgi:hypothetical protein
MISYKCPNCTFSFNESDKAWDRAIANGTCPKCDSPLVNFSAPTTASDTKQRQNIRDSYLVEVSYKNSFLKLWSLRLAGFFIGATIGFVILISVLFVISALSESNLSPRGPAWLIVPISFGFAIASYAPLLWLSIEKYLVGWILKLSKSTRLFLAAIAIWASSVGIYVYMFEPYGYITNTERIHLLKVIIFPIVIYYIGLFIYKKIVRDAD